MTPENEVIVLRAEHERVKAELHQANEDGAELVRLVTRVVRAEHAMFANLTTTQARCTELLEEVRALKAEREGLVKELVRTVMDEAPASEPVPCGAV